MYHKCESDFHDYLFVGGPSVLILFGVTLVTLFTYVCPIGELKNTTNTEIIYEHMVDIIADVKNFFGTFES